MASQHGRRPVDFVEPVELHWQPDGLPPPVPSSYFSYQHEVIAAKLRERPGVWALLPNLPVNYAGAINKGQITAYRPGGSYEAVNRNNQLYIRYVGQEEEGHE